MTPEREALISDVRPGDELYIFVTTHAARSASRDRGRRWRKVRAIEPTDDPCVARLRFDDGAEVELSTTARVKVARG